MRIRRRGAVRHQSSPTASQRFSLLGRLLQQTALWSLFLGVLWVSYQGISQLLDPARHPVRHVVLQTPLNQLHPTEVEAVLAPLLGQNFFLADLWGAHRQLQALPWVATVRLERHWPDRVHVSLTERVAVAHWGNHMVTADGTVFAPRTFRQLQVWPRLAGLAGQQRAALDALAFAQETLAPLELTVTGLRQDDRQAWTVFLSNGVALELGREQFAERLALFATRYPQALATRINEVQTVDLRYERGFAVRWRGKSG